MAKNNIPRFGEIWIIDLDPTKGHEKQKIRPVVVISNNLVSASPLRLIVPVTERKPGHSNFTYMIELPPTTMNGLQKLSTADCLHLRSVDLTRFKSKMGRLEAKLLQEIKAAIELLL